MSEENTKKHCVKCDTELFLATVGDSLFKYCPYVKCEVFSLFQFGIAHETEEYL